MKLRINLKFSKITVILIAIILLIVLLFSLIAKWETAHGLIDTSDSNTPDDGRLYLNEICYIPNEDLEVILLIGVDKYEFQSQTEGYNNSQQADFLMLLLINKKAETYTMLHINRDTMTDIPVLGVRGEKAGTINGQLALAHTFGSGGMDSCRNTVEAVSNLLYGIEIDHYLAFTMDAVSEINDLAGGVTISVLDDLTSVSPEMYKGATLTLDGEMALAYVRTRYGLEDSSNLRRMERQRQYLTALRTALSARAASQEDFMFKALEKISTYMTSDYTADQLSKLYERINSYKDNGIQTIDGEAIRGDEFMEFYPDEIAIKQQIVQLFYVPLEE